MAILRTTFTMAAAGGLMATLAGCMSGGTGGGGPPITTQPTGVEGSWIDERGTGLSTLAGGKFQTTATDTGQKLADGTYTITSANSVTINGTSLIRQTQVSFNCLLANPNQLNCTSASGQQFVLTRRTA